MEAMQKTLEHLKQGPPDEAPFSVALRDSQKPGRSPVYRHWMYQDALFATLEPNITTIHEMFELSGQCHGYHKSSLHC
jgi:long-chain acyl-CoA synthetase